MSFTSTESAIKPFVWSCLSPVFKRKTCPEGITVKGNPACKLGSGGPTWDGSVVEVLAIVPSAETKLRGMNGQPFLFKLTFRISSVSE